MTTIYEAAARANVPQLHALVIGVGRYQYLPGGAQARPGLPPLGQPTSAAFSARRVVDWLLTRPLNYLTVEIGSVELLLSDTAGQAYVPPVPPVPPAGGLAAPNQPNVDAATMAAPNNIQPAFERWFGRCNARTSDVAMFYFCGHGIRRFGDLLLLPEDFGIYQQGTYNTSINFNKTYANLSACKARRQMVVIDACQTASDIAEAALNGDGVSLLNPSVNDLDGDYTSILIQASGGLPAFGTAGQTSRVTEAFLQSLEEAAWSLDQGAQYWEVTDATIKESVKHLVNSGNKRRSQQESQSVKPDGPTSSNWQFVICRMQQRPQVRVSVFCDPGSYNANATFGYRVNGGAWTQAPAQGIYDLQLDAGLYDFSCTLPGRPPPLSICGRLILPPPKEITFEVQ